MTAGRLFSWGRLFGDVDRCHDGGFFESEVTIGSDRFAHGLFTIGARSPALASTQTDISVPQPGNVVSTSGALPAANSVTSSWDRPVKLPLYVTSTGMFG